MARLIYSVIASLDGYVADEDGKFEWAAPDEEVHAFTLGNSTPGLFAGTFSLDGCNRLCHRAVRWAF
jgi:hypothetical protein